MDREGVAMSRDLGATQLKVVQPDEGDTGVLRPGVGVRFKIDAADVGGNVNLGPVSEK